MIVNINYSGELLESTSQFLFSVWKPKQFVQKCDGYTIVIFKTGKCRIMGCKTRLLQSTLPFKINNIKIQSITVTKDLGKSVNLYKMAIKLGSEAMYEPELFPALRLLKFNPLCVNIFSSGKIVILGIKIIDYKDIVSKIMKTILNIEREIT